MPSTEDAMSENAMLRRTCLLMLTWLCALPQSGAAVDYIATRYDDPAPSGCNAGDCSLREAVIAANESTAVADRILLSAGHYFLQIAGTDEDDAVTGDLDLGGNLEIVGPGAPMTRISANGLDRIFDLQVNIASGPLRLAGLELTGGQIVSGIGGAAIRLGAANELTIEACTIHGNAAPNGGYGTIQGFISSGALTVRGSTLHDNTAGGIRVIQYELTVENSTLAGNAGPEIVGIAAGTEIVLSQSTIRDSESGAEVSVSDAGALLEIANSVVIGNCEPTNGGSILTQGGNVESPGDSCNLGVFDEADVASPGLGLLADNGGPTPTFFPALGSPAVGGGQSGNCTPLDQRGVPRIPASCESGAVERAVVRPLTPIFHDGFQQGDDEAWGF